MGVYYSLWVKAFHVRGVANDFTTFSPTLTKIVPSRVQGSRIFRSRFSVRAFQAIVARDFVMSALMNKFVPFSFLAFRITDVFRLCVVKRTIMSRGFDRSSALYMVNCATYCFEKSLIILCHSLLLCMPFLKIASESRCTIDFIYLTKKNSTMLLKLLIFSHLFVASILHYWSWHRNAQYSLVHFRVLKLKIEDQWSLTSLLYSALIINIVYAMVDCFI